MIVTEALNVFPAQPVPPTSTKPVVAVTLNAALTTEPHTVIDAALPEEIGAVIVAPCTTSVPPALTVTFALTLAHGGSVRRSREAGR